jgi:HEAT repeat protein
MKTRLLCTSLAIGLLVGMLGCHASDDDPEGQAKELADPVRRQNAIRNLHRIYTNKLAEQGGDRNAPDVRAVADVIYEPMNKVYIDNPQDTQNGQAILDLMQEMRDPRTVPALVRALDWRTEVSEEHAIRAAQTIQRLQVPEDKKAEVIQALGNAFDKVEGARPVDNRMRVEFLRALGRMKDKRATPVLVKIMTDDGEAQDFLINRLAAQQLGAMGDPEAVPHLIEALFLFDARRPQLRMNDVAAEALVRIGRPALDPLKTVLKGKHERANELAKAYIEAVRGVSPQAAAGMSVDMITSGEGTFALGALGFREALDPLLAQTTSSDMDRRLNAAIALVRLNLKKEDLPRVRESLKAVYKDVDAMARPQVIAAARHLYDAETLPFFLAEASDTDNHPVIRIEAVNAYSLLADKSETARMRALIAKEPGADEGGGYKAKFKEMEPALDAAEKCDRDISCWIQKFDESDRVMQRKAAYMLGRLARDNEQAIKKLVERLDSSEIEVRMAVVAALDRIATHGSAEAVEKINQLREVEEGRAIWTQFSREALPIQARLRTRGEG